MKPLWDVPSEKRNDLLAALKSKDYVSEKSSLYVLSRIFNWRASERSEQDTLRGNTIENRGCLFVYMFGRTYVICILTLSYFRVNSAFDPVPNIAKQYPPV